MSAGSPENIDDAVKQLQQEEKKLARTIKGGNNENTVFGGGSRIPTQRVSSNNLSIENDPAIVKIPPFNYQPNNSVLINLITKVAENK